MYNANILGADDNQNIFTGVRKIYAFLKLSISVMHLGYSFNKSNEGYMLNAITKGQTVIDIGTHKSSYICFLLKKVGSTGSVIAFETHINFYRYLLKVKQLLLWRNVTIELLDKHCDEAERSLSISFDKCNAISWNGARIINFKGRIYNKFSAELTPGSLDDYCSTHHILPHVLIMNADGNELELLRGAMAVLQSCKPKIMLTCEERKVGRAKVVETFKFLMDLDYNGYFILDTIRIPLENFDFDLYQNPRNDFYCSSFIFE